MRDDTQPQAPPRGGSEGVSAGRLLRRAGTPRLQNAGRLPRDAMRQVGSAFAWTALAVSAVLYLLLLLPARDEMTALLPKVTVLAQAEPTGPTEVSMSEVAKLRAQIEDLTREVRDLRARDAALQRRFDELQLALGPTTAALPQETTDITAAIGTPPPMPAKPPVTVAYLPLPADGFGDTLLGVSPIPIASAGPLTRTMFGVEIAMGDTVDTLRTRWMKLQAAHGALFEGLEVRQDTTGDKQPSTKNKHRLVAGPFDNAADAARLCARLKAASLTCKETVFAGDSL